MTNPLVLRKRDGTPIEKWEDWTRPKKAEYWKAGRSAMELARSWFSSGAAQVPPEVERLLASHPLTQRASFHEGHPELVTPLPERGEGRNHDLMLLGQANGQSLTVCVEAKADEDFGELIDDYYRRTRTKQRTESTRVPERIQKLLTLVFGTRATPRENPWKQLRYQLLTGLAGTILQAEKNGSPRAVFLVHEFHTNSTVLSELTKNADDYAHFIETVFGVHFAGVVSGQLYGPKTFTGNGSTPIEILVGKTL